MADLMDKETQEELKTIFSQMHKSVTLKFFTQDDCPNCLQQHELLETLASLSDKISLETYDLNKDADQAKAYRIDKVPATAIIGAKDYGIRFFGITGGHEFGSFIQSLMLAETGLSQLPPELDGFVKQIDTPLHLEIMTTLTCPYCAKMVVTAHQLCVASEFIRADMIDSAEFPQLVELYQVNGVPKTVINGSASFEGALPCQMSFWNCSKPPSPNSMRK